MPVATTDLEERVRTSLDLPQELQERIRRAVQRGIAKSQNALIVRAVEEYLAQLERDWIDAQFAEMEHDEGYQALNRQIEKEFSRSDWEALQTVGGQR
ncbi:MAG: CopG family transcriptional regulator [Anaerolineae bacterium]|nr:CopG family transcriptional regulator [Anaerolineae bacterium]